MVKSLPCVLTIAGSDSSGGAGIQADIKTISALNCYAASVITAVTAQNTQGVQSVAALSEDLVAAQLEAVFTDLNIQAVKIGMLFNAPIMQTVAHYLKKFAVKSIILDPVMIAKNGSPLLQPEAIDALASNLFSLCQLITPNLNEAMQLLNMKIENEKTLENAAKILAQKYKTTILIKGGHLDSKTASDVFYADENKLLQWFHAPRIASKNTHGTGCTLSAAIAAFVAQDYDLIAAIHAAKKYLSHAIHAGQYLAIGKGIGPVDHFYYLRNKTHDL